MASALEQLTNNYETAEPVSFYDYYNAYGRDHSKSKWYDVDPNSLGARFQNWLTGTKSSAEKDYEKYLAEYEYQRNLKATTAQNALTFAREDSQIQRLLQDYSKAGLNPYSILVGGNLSSGVASSQAAAPSYKRGHSKSESKQKSNLATSAIKAIALLAMLG